MASFVSIPSLSFYTFGHFLQSFLDNNGCDTFQDLYTNLEGYNEMCPLLKEGKDALRGENLCNVHGLFVRSNCM